MQNAKLWVLLCWVIMSYSPCILAEEPSEYTLKAAFLYNFAVFTTWPDSHIDTFKLCIYGSDPFGPGLDAMLEKKKINDLTITIHRTNNIDYLDQCQLVFISRSAIASLANVIDVLKNQPILTVADSPNALQLGASLNMDIKENKITFEVNLGVARKVGLNLSSRLLSLASMVYQ